MQPRYRSLVLCFHAVSDWSHELAVAPEAFGRILTGLLGRGYRPVHAHQVLSGETRLLHVTFDDAYRSVWNAVPVLERLGVPATVFVSTAYADNGGAPLGIPELAESARTDPEELLTMDWDALSALTGRGIEIGAHSVTHAHLPELSDEALAVELGDARERIESQLARPCRFLAYPFGENDARVRAAAERAGYAAAFALRGPSWPPDLFALPRVGLYRGDSGFRGRLKTSTLRGAGSRVLDAVMGSRRQPAQA
jgi:peptidoglycan/xylan/chitin deacetylase (PgdA/CDA1 family)